jgi:PAS domain-containing protein
MTKLNEAADPNRPVVENAQRPGTVTRLVLLALVLIATAAAFVWFRDQLENEIVLGILGVLAMAGIFFLVSAFIGFVEVMPQNRMDILSHAVLNSQPDGIVITDRKGSIVYANAAYGRLAGADAATGAISIEHLLSKSRESTEAVYRLTNGLMEGKAGAEEFRLPGGIGSRRGRRSSRKSAAGLSSSGRYPTSRPSAASRKSSSANCRTPSTISTTRRPASSPPAVRARFSMSMPRSPIGWASTSPNSNPAR